MKFLDKHLDALCDALASLRDVCRCEFSLDDVCWASDGSYTSVSLYCFEPSVNYYQTLRVFDLTTPVLNPSILLFFCLQAIFPGRSNEELFKMRDKLYKKYFK